jgi:hypothetical protein
LTLRTTNIFRKLIQSKLAVALPVTFLILFVTTLGLVSVTYYFSIQKIGSESQLVRIATAKQDLLSLDSKILSTSWNPGSSSTINLKDFGVMIRIQPDSNQLKIVVNDTSNIQEVIFNSHIGGVICELPYSGTSQSGVFLQGDSRTIVNQTGSTQSQVNILRGSEHPEIHLSYRPVVSYFSAEIENGKQVTDVRIYVTNMNSSTILNTQGELPLRIKCLDAQLVSKSFDVNYQPLNLIITSAKDDSTGNVIVPISSSALGAIVNLEVVTVNIAIERWVR